jgi:hypothetical protein
VTGHHTVELATAAHWADDTPGDGDRAALLSLGRQLHSHRGDDLGEILRTDGHAERLELWRTLLSRLGTIPGVDAVDAWRLFLRHPCAVFDNLEDFFGGLVRSRFRWRTLTEIYEMWYRMAADQAVPGVTRQEMAQALGPLSRTRWLLLSAPFAGDLSQGVLTSGTRPRGPDAERARQARDDWLGVLTVIEDYPGLSSAIDVEKESAALTETDLGRPGDPDRTRAQVIGYVVTRLLLPRFAWASALRCVHRTGAPVTPCLAVTATLFASALGSFLFASFHRWAYGFTAAAITASAGYGAITIGALYRRSLGWLWLLRQPASAAVGLLTLATLPANWWWTSAEKGTAAHVLNGTIWQATVALALLGVGYLAIEVSNHGVRGWKIVWRSIGTAFSGLMHAFMVSLIGLRWIVPAFAAAPDSEPTRLTCWWTTTGCGPHALAPWLIVLAASAWSFVTGVFLQILWDDQPITAPLTHVTWRHGR